MLCNRFLAQRLALFLFFIPLFGVASVTNEKQGEIDSLNQLLNSEIHDTARVQALVGLTEVFYGFNKDTTEVLAIQAILQAELGLGGTDDLNEQRSYHKSISTLYETLGDVYFRTGKYLESERCYEKVVAIKEANGFEGRPYIMNQIAVVNLNLFDYAKSLEASYKACELAEQLPNPTRADSIVIALALHSTALAHHQLGDWDECNTYLMKSLQLAEKIRQTRLAAQILGEVGTYYIEHQKDTAQAIEYFERALVLQKKLKRNRGIALQLYSLAAAYESNDRGKAYAYIEEGLSYAMQQKPRSELVDLLHLKAKMKLDEGKLAEAEKYALEAMEVCGNKFGREKGKVAEVLVSVYNLKQDYKTALHYYEIQVTTNNKVKNLDNQREGLNTAKKHEIEQIRVEETYQRELALKDAELKDQKIVQLRSEKAARDLIIFGVVIISILVFYLLFLWFRGYRRKIEVRELQAEKEVKLLLQQVNTLQGSLETRLVENTALDAEKLNANLSALMKTPLTRREIDVLLELSKGKENKEIASDLFLSVNTVRSHLLKIYDKLDVKNRTQAIKKAENLNRLEVNG